MVFLNLFRNPEFFKNLMAYKQNDKYYNDQEFHICMSSKRGVGITVGILVAITIGSFMVWFGNPTNTDMTIVVTDFENHDAGIVERHKIVSNSIEESFGKFVEGQIDIVQYEKIAETGSSQNNALFCDEAFFAM